MKYRSKLRGKKRKDLKKGAKGWRKTAGKKINELLTHKNKGRIFKFKKFTVFKIYEFEYMLSNELKNFRKKRQNGRKRKSIRKTRGGKARKPIIVRKRKT